MFGAIIGDIAGSAYERLPKRGLPRLENKNFPLFPEGCRYTDDTTLTVAVADAILSAQSGSTEFIDFASSIKRYARIEPRRGYGHRFGQWISEGAKKPYFSFGNGSAMRVSPCGWWCDSLSGVEAMAQESAQCSHNHPEGIKGAVVTAGCIFLARDGASKDDIRKYVTESDYDVNRTVQDIVDSGYIFDSSCQGSVPEAIVAFLDSENYEDCIRNAIFLGGDADTQAAIAGSIAEAFYGGVPDELREKAISYLNDSVLPVALRFDEEVVRKKLRVW